MKLNKLFYIVLGILVISGCNQYAITPPSATSFPMPILTYKILESN